LKICKYCDGRIWFWQAGIKFEDDCTYHCGCLQRKLKADLIKQGAKVFAEVAIAFLERYEDKSNRGIGG